jgi:hypothetical protein
MRINQPLITKQPRNKQINKNSKDILRGYVHPHHHHKATKPVGFALARQVTTDQLTEVTDRVTPTNGPGERRKPRICVLVSGVGTRSEAGKAGRGREGTKEQDLKPRHGNGRMLSEKMRNSSISMLCVLITRPRM